MLFQDCNRSRISDQFCNRGERRKAVGIDAFDFNGTAQCDITAGCTGKDLIFAGLCGPLLLLNIIAGKVLLTQFKCDSLLLAGLQEYLFQSLEFLNGLVKRCLHIVDIDLNNLAAGHAAGIFDVDADVDGLAILQVCLLRNLQTGQRKTRSLEPVVKIKGTVIDLAEYSAYRYGYTFDGWYADEALTQRVTSVTLDADKTVYAAWTRNRFFEDVTIADWFYDDVMFVCGRGVMQGVSDTRFGPHLTATRAMMATILWRMEGSPAPTAEARFTDVRSGQWYSEAVAWTAQSGVYTGYADGSFRPNDSITREQLAAILYRYAKYKGVDVSVGEDTNILSYADAAEISDYAFPAMQWACGAGVMQGSNGNLLPRGRATRAQIAAMLHRYLVK